MKTTPIQEAIERLMVLSKDNNHNKFLSAAFKMIAEGIERDLLPKEEELIKQSYLQAYLDTYYSRNGGNNPSDEDLLEMQIEAEKYYNNNFKQTNNEKNTI